MSKPTVRVLALLELLQSNGQLSGSVTAWWPVSSSRR